ncbi:MAG: hypothetical protein KatS3mg115_2224 [Candidatus Poribacteria bacterium]|nr:MAG: hypothetical protein KatS3mg115_2224 [Candidatus Poribacteria bacterium]
MDRRRSRRGRWGVWVWLGGLFLGIGHALAGSAPPPDARSMGLAGAFVAVASDPSALYYNPAGLTGPRGVSVLATRAALFSGPVDPLVVEDVLLMRLGGENYGLGVGVGFLRDREAVYRETTLRVGGALRVADRLQVGFQVNGLRLGLDGSNPDVRENPYFSDRTGAVAYTVDLGLLLALSDSWRIGLAGQRLLSSDRRFRQDLGEPDTLPALVRVGVAYNLSPLADALEQAALRDVFRRSLLTADLAFGDGTTAAVGLELGMAENAAVRIGFRSVGGREKGTSALTAGGSIGVQLGDVQLWADYALEISQIALKDNLSSRISLRFLY